MKRAARKRANGQGSVYFNDRLNRYMGQVTISQGQRKTFYGPKGDDSSKARLGIEERMRPFQQRRLSDGARTVQTLLEDFLEHHTELSPKTLSLYRTASKHILGDGIARKRLVDLEPMDVKTFYGRLETGSTMKLKVHVLLHRILEEAVDLELIHRNPASRVPKPKVERKEMTVWSPDEVLKFLQTARSHRLYALFILALTSTMGPAELFALKRSDVHLQGGFVTVNRNLVTVAGRVIEKDTKKAKRRRRIDLPAIAIEALRERFKMALAEGHAGSTYVFTSPEGGPIRSENFRRRVWEPLIELAGVTRITPYGLRHTANAVMGYLGVPIQVAQDRMGHTSIKTTVDVYGHLYESAGREAARKLDDFLAVLQ